MNEYVTLIALSYFNQYKEHYVLSDLVQILGMTSKKFDELIDELFNKQYIEYKNNLIEITERGTSQLVASNMFYYDDKNQEFMTLHANKDVALPVDQPYIPQKFFTKIRKKNS